MEVSTGAPRCNYLQFSKRGAESRCRISNGNVGPQFLTLRPISRIQCIKGDLGEDFEAGILGGESLESC